MSLTKFISALNMAQDSLRAQRYVESRKVDAARLVKGIESGTEKYANVVKYGSTFIVNRVHCADFTCAIAFILARFW